MASDDAPTTSDTQPIASTSRPSKLNVKKPRKSASDSRMAATAVVSADAHTPQIQHHLVEPDEDDTFELKYGASHVIHLFVPVSVCMAVVIFTMSTIGYYSRNDGVYLVYTPFTKQTDSTSELLIMSIGNALTLLCVVIVMTVILILLYKFRWYKVIHGWLIVSSLMLLSMFTGMYLQELFKNYNMAVDYVTVLFIIWNYGCVGMLCIHWKGPLRLQQAYLIAMSALMALVFIKYLPDWTVWTVLAVLSIWDLVAVLCPNGPLRILVETAQERNEPIFPALIYSSGILYMYTLLTDQVGDPVEESAPTADIAVAVPADPDGDSSVTRRANANRRYAPLRGQSQERNQEANSAQHGQQNAHAAPKMKRRHSVTGVPPSERVEVEERGIKLGLGDFIFYSVLVGKASSYGDWNTTIACYVAILIGLAFTLMLLALFRKALPALPISIFAGITFYFATRGLITPFTSEVSIRQYLL